MGERNFGCGDDLGMVLEMDRHFGHENWDQAGNIAHKPCQLVELPAFLIRKFSYLEQL